MVVSAHIPLAAWLGGLIARIGAGLAPVAEPVTEEAVVDCGKSRGVKTTWWAGWPVQRESPPALDTVLGALHRAARGKEWERELWNGVFNFVPAPLPREVALDLIERGIGRHWFAHSWQHEEVWWRLVDQDEEAVYNLAYKRYTDPKDDWNRVNEVFHQFPLWEDLIDQLSRAAPTPPEKAAALARLAREKGVGHAIEKYRAKWDPTFAAAWDAGTLS